MDTTPFRLPEVDLYNTYLPELNTGAFRLAIGSVQLITGSLELLDAGLVFLEAGGADLSNGVNGSLSLTLGSNDLEEGAENFTDGLLYGEGFMLPPLENYSYPADNIISPFTDTSGGGVISVMAPFGGPPGEIQPANTTIIQP